MKKITLFFMILCAFSFNQDVMSGYLRAADFSMCVDECGRYFIESELDSGFGVTSVVFSDDIDVSLYLNRFVEAFISEEVIDCTECSAILITEISMSDECSNLVSCIVDPCEVADSCQLNTPVDCVASYCGGCNADFYDLDNNLVDCYGSNDEEDLENEDWDCSNFITQEECRLNDCDWSYEDGCYRSSEEESLLYCLSDCEISNSFDFNQNTAVEACDWFISNLGPFNYFNSCAEDCETQDFIEINQIIEDCYICIEDSDINCLDIFSSDENDCFNIDNFEECQRTEGCEWSDSEGCYFFEQNINDVYCSDIVNPDECDLANGCLWSFSNNMPNGGDCIDINPDFEICSDIVSPDECDLANGCDWSYDSSDFGQCLDSIQSECQDLSDIDFGLCERELGFAWNGQGCTLFSGCNTVDQSNGVNYSNSFYESIQDCQSDCTQNQESSLLYGSVDYIWGDAIELVQGAQISIISDQGSYLTQTNSQGFYSLEIPIGEYSVSVTAYAETQIQTIIIDLANQDFMLNFSLGSFNYQTALTGIVYGESSDLDLAPIEGATISVSYLNDFVAEALTNNDGFFEITLPPSNNQSYDIIVQAEGFDAVYESFLINGITVQNFYLTEYNNIPYQAEISLGSSIGYFGQEVAVPLFLKSEVESKGIQFEVNLSDNDAVTPIGLDSTYDCFNANYNNVNNQFNGVIYSLDDSCLYPANELVHIANLIYFISDNIYTNSSIMLSFEDIIISDTNGQEISSIGQGNIIQIGLKGDVNFDGSINISDIIRIVNFAIQIDSPANSEYWASDLNEDNQINILDIILVVNIILDNE
ncbi:MAG: hypothetical protein CMG00_03705 [Candidatus Marinimicrobia bacterium]|nr:hypothetical protein [Candidatus Neomarinimicrobiota bacterium]|tara:strand:- start:3385 stop:5844 length:2460 start_codon:yes stop_codon:yes gene_type:complete